MPSKGEGRVKAVGLLSGGLDSTLAVKVMLELGVEVLALNFVTPFCTCDRGDSGCGRVASRVSRELGVPLKVVSVGEEYLEMLAAPAHGYGRNMNPCIDCRIMMQRLAGAVMREEGASFIFTGEVLGQRPMSQRRDAMDIIDRESGLRGYVLRPLSAKLLRPTVVEEQGLVDRERLLAISGRSRKPQMALAEEYEIHNYPCAAGGCLLTSEGFANRIRDLLAEGRGLTLRDVQLARVGRHFRVSRTCKVVVGRNQEENRQIEGFVQGNTLLGARSCRGPLALAVGTPSLHEVHLAAKITARYCSSPPGEPVEVEVRPSNVGESEILTVRPLGDKDLEDYRI